MQPAQRSFKEKLKDIVTKNKSLYNLSQIILGNKSLTNNFKQTIKGKGNKVEYDTTTIFTHCTVNINGNNNHIRIADFCKFNNVSFNITGDNHRISIGNHVDFSLGGNLWIEDNDCVIDIQEGSFFQDVHIAVTEPGSEITIGKDCLFAYDIDLRTGDSHSIIDTTTGKRINHAKNITVGNHVWVAAHCSILKGVTVADNCIIATRSTISKAIEQQGVIIGGSPAKILKENVTWDRARIYEQ